MPAHSITDDSQRQIAKGILQGRDTGQLAESLPNVSRASVQRYYTKFERLKRCKQCAPRGCDLEAILVTCEHVDEWYITLTLWPPYLDEGPRLQAKWFVEGPITSKIEMPDHVEDSIGVGRSFTDFHEALADYRRRSALLHDRISLDLIELAALSYWAAEE